MNKNSDIWFWLAIIANICQLDSWQMNVAQSSNDDIMTELQNQDKEYLKEIIKQNNEIIKLLGGKHD